MSTAAVRVGVGTRFSYDGEVVEVVELLATMAGSATIFGPIPVIVHTERPGVPGAVGNTCGRGGHYLT